MYYVQDVKLQRDEACLKWVSFPKRQWSDTINLREWSLYPRKRVLPLNRRLKLAPCAVPSWNCFMLYNLLQHHLLKWVGYSLEMQATSYRDSSLRSLWTFVLQNKTVPAREIYGGWRRIAGMPVARGAPQGGVEEETGLKPQAEGRS